MFAVAPVGLALLLTGPWPGRVAPARERPDAAAKTRAGGTVRSVGGDTPFGGPFGVVAAPDGAILVCETTGHRISRLDPATGERTTVVGTGEAGNDGDGGPATKARVDEPYEIAFDAAGQLHFVDRLAHVVRRVDAGGVITTVAGNGTEGFSGDGGPATKAQMKQPHSIAFGPDGGLTICDIGNHRVRRVDPATGVITTWAGTGAKKPTPHDAPRIGTPLNGPRAIVFGPSPGGGPPSATLALREGNAILRLDPATDRWQHVAGTGKQGYSGDGGPAAKAQLAGPKGLAVDGAGTIYLADTESHTVRRIDAATGIITTVVGDGTAGDGPDGPGAACRLDRPHGVGLMPDGSLLIGDSGNDRVRRLVPPSGPAP